MKVAIVHDWLNQMGGAERVLEAADGWPTIQRCLQCCVNANADQADVDADGLGDLCDPCPEIYEPEYLRFFQARFKPVA